MRETASPVANAIPRIDGDHLVPDARLRLTFEDINAFILMKMNVEFGCFVTRIYFDYMDPKSRQSR
jgi:hypothetical protein